MRFLREMIVRKSASGVSGDAAEEPPVKDFFELPPMRDRLARSRSADLDARAPDLDEDDPEDAGEVSAVVAQRLSAARHVPVEKPREDRPRAASDGFDDLEFGAFDPAELDALDIDAPAVPDSGVVAERSSRAAGLDPQFARRPMSTPRMADPADGPVFADHEDADDLDGGDDLTDDPALAGLVAGRRAAPVAADRPMPEAARPMPEAARPVPEAARPVPEAARPVPGAARPAAADDDSSILANIAAALPPSVRAVLPAAPAAPVAPAARVAADAAPAAVPPVRDLAPPAPVWPTAPATGAAPLTEPARPSAARTPRIWDLEPEAQEAAVMRFAETAVPPPHGVLPTPAAAAPAVPAAAHLPASEPLATEPPRRSGRVRTRLLGFTATEDIVPDPMAGTAVPRASGLAQFPVGWIVVTDGPGRGAAFTLGAGVSSIGRDEDQVIQLDFGDNSISRHMHAAIAYDPETRGFFLGQGGKSNIVRLNGRPVLSTEDLKDGDMIRIGETTLKLVAFCGKHFDWADAPADPRNDAGR